MESWSILVYMDWFSKTPLPPVANVVIQVIYITCSCQVFVFPILQSPHDVALIFRTCQLHTAWELLHENGGNERQAAWHPFPHRLWSSPSTDRALRN